MGKEETNKSKDIEKFKKQQLYKQKINLYKKSDIPEKYFRFKWEDYKPSHNSRTSIVSKEAIESRLLAKKSAIVYVNNINKNINTGKSIVFFGPKSSGKTVLATLILREGIEKYALNVRYVRFLSLVSYEFENKYMLSQEELKSIYDYYIDPDILCIDEIENISVKEWVKSSIYEILVERFNQRKPTIITSKIDFQLIKKVCGDGFYNILNDNQMFEACYIDSDGISLSDTDIEKETFYNLKIIIDGLQELYSKEKKEIKKSKTMYNKEPIIKGERIIQEIVKGKIFKNKENTDINLGLDGDVVW